MMNIAEVAQNSRASQNKVELAKVLKYVSEISPKVVVEIGVHRGYSLLDWRRAFDPEILIGIENDIAYLDLDATATAQIIDGDSHNENTVKELIHRLNGRQIDFLYIDGDHTYNGVKNDYLMYSPLVRSGGIIGFDDICLDSNEWRMAGVDVARFWNELIGKPGTKYYVFWDMNNLPTDGTGDGLYYKP